MLRAIPLLLTLAASAPAPHPIHSSSALLTIAPDGRHATLSIRVFAEDFPPGIRADQIVPYLAERFRISSPSSRAISRRLERTEVTGPVQVVELSLEAPGGLEGATLWHGVLMERFSDQVNLVQVRRGTGGRITMLLFSPGDGPKPL